MRANTGRDLIIKIEGTYHGHHDSLMFSVAPDPADMGPREHPRRCRRPGASRRRSPSCVRVVPFNDLDAVRREVAEEKATRSPA